MTTRSRNLAGAVLLLALLGGCTPLSGRGGGRGSSNDDDSGSADDDDDDSNGDDSFEENHSAEDAARVTCGEEIDAVALDSDFFLVVLESQDSISAELSWDDSGVALLDEMWVEGRYQPGVPRLNRGHKGEAPWDVYHCP